LPPELVAVIAKDAHQRGMRVSGHIPTGMTAAECVRLGYDEIQHVNFLFLNFMPEVKDTRTPARFTAVAAGAGDIDVNSPAVQDFIRLLKERHTTLDPTLSIFEGMFTDRPGEVPVGMAAVYDRLPSQTRRGFLSDGLAVPDGMDGKYRRSFANALVLIHAMYVAGVPIEAGTDAFSGFSLHRELELEVQAGIPPPEVLKLATLGAARIMRRDSELGSLTSGKLADLVIVDGNPMIDISAVRKPALVIKDGVVYRPKEIDQELGIRP
jgi:imidazolonepropionase-like amidohydrolase